MATTSSESEREPTRMPLNRKCLNRTYGPSRFEVTEQRIESFLEATLDSADAYRRGAVVLAPPTLAFLPSWPVILAALADPDLGNDGQIIHGEQVMRWVRPLVGGDRLTTTGEVTSIENKGRNELYVLTLRTHDDLGRLVVDQENICVSLGTGSAYRTGKPRPKAPPANGQGDEPAVLSSFSVEQDLPATIAEQYAAASGDHNKVHLDAEFAQRLGFPGVIVQGMCLVSIALRGVVHDVVHDDLDRIADLRVRFLGPAQPGECLTTHYAVRPGACTFESYAADGRKVLGAGVVTLTTKEDADA